MPADSMLHLSQDVKVGVHQNRILEPEQLITLLFTQNRNSELIRQSAASAAQGSDARCLTHPTVPLFLALGPDSAGRKARNITVFQVHRVARFPRQQHQKSG